ncbi:MAG: serine hydrolase domain-containing protein [Actinomycetota bacterium]
MIDVTDADLDFTAVEERMQWYIDQELVPYCSMAVLKGTDIVYLRHLGGGTPETTLTDDSILRMHSSTKLATSVVAMMLHEEGRFGLDDPVAEYLPLFADLSVLRPGATSAEDVEPANEPILIRHLLSHSAGLSYGFVDPTSLIDRIYTEVGLNPLTGRGLTLTSVADGVAAVPLAYQPGTSWRYSLATDVVAKLIEVLCEANFGTVMRERLFAPLGMVDTDFRVAPENADRLSTMFNPADPLDPMVPGLTALPHEPARPDQPAWQSGGGGLFSTLVDYLAFIRMVINGGEWEGRRYLRAETLELMRSNHLAPGVEVEFPVWSMPHTTFGLGFARKDAPGRGEPDTAVDEYHWGGLAGTHFWMAPRAELTGVCITQRMPGFFHPFSRDFKRLVYDIAG